MCDVHVQLGLRTDTENANFNTCIITNNVSSAARYHVARSHKPFIPNTLCVCTVGVATQCVYTVGVSTPEP